MYDVVNGGKLFDAIKNDEAVEYLETDPMGVAMLPSTPE